MKRIIPFLWFSKNAEEAVNFYISIFPNSKILGITHASTDTPSGPKGSVLTVN
jgi:predicted 3-demethylubiquinone-9 3-methyltransferase (glyoxalase superfamily)